MQLRLKTKFTLTTSLMVLAVVALVSSIYVANVTRDRVAGADRQAKETAQRIFVQAQHAIDEAAEESSPPSLAAGDIREWVRQALDADGSFTASVDAAVSFSSPVYEVTLVDTDGIALISSDASLHGRTVLKRPSFDYLYRANFFQQIGELYLGEQTGYEVTLPFDIAGQPFGEIRVGLSAALLKAEIAPKLAGAVWLAVWLTALATLAAAVISHRTLRPLTRISAQLDKIARGQFDPAQLEPLSDADELGQVSTKISLIGQQLRGVQEIFSTLRENIDQVMSGLDDGLILFMKDGRAVLVSPSVERFLGAGPEKLLGRRVSEIFPAGHPLQRALDIRGDQLGPVEGVEVQLVGGAPNEPMRASASVQLISENGRSTGALVTLRDLDSLERLGSQLQISERMSALGRVTAGVAHEVKNPLNSMRLWLENLKQSLPAPPPSTDGEPAMAQQAVKILDSEIDRLDRVVKTFLDFTKPVELELTDVDLRQLMTEVATVAQPQIERAGVQLEIDLPPRIPLVHADRQLVKQAVLNLALNAVQAMSAPAKPGSNAAGHAGADGNAGSRKSRLTLGLKRVGDYAQIVVADTGPGIPPEHRAKVFQLFFTTRPSGSGIGLATTFRVVQLHNGSIDFESEQGRGTTFRIELPLAHGAFEEAAPASMEQAK